MKRALAICLAGLFSSGAMAADLMQVYQDALANDAKFAAARAQLEAGQESVVQGRAGLLPQLGLSADAAWNDAEININWPAIENIQLSAKDQQGIELFKAELYE